EHDQSQSEQGRRHPCDALQRQHKEAHLGSLRQPSISIQRMSCASPIGQKRMFFTFLVKAPWYLVLLMKMPAASSTRMRETSSYMARRCSWSVISSALLHNSSTRAFL